MYRNLLKIETYIKLTIRKFLETLSQISTDINIEE